MVKLVVYIITKKQHTELKNIEVEKVEKGAKEQRKDVKVEKEEEKDPKEEVQVIKVCQQIQCKY